MIMMMTMSDGGVGVDDGVITIYLHISNNE
jgi:hypothetical protein